MNIVTKYVGLGWNWGIVAGIALDPVIFLITFPMKQAKEIGLDLNVFFSIQTAIH